MISRWRWIVDLNLMVLFCVHNSTTTLSKVQSLHRVLQVAVDTCCCMSFLTSSIYFSFRFHYSIRPVTTDFRSSSSVIWHTSALFHLTEKASWQPLTPFSDEASVNNTLTTGPDGALMTHSTSCWDMPRFYIIPLCESPCWCQHTILYLSDYVIAGIFNRFSWRN